MEIVLIWLIFCLLYLWTFWKKDHSSLYTVQIAQRTPHIFVHCSFEGTEHLQKVWCFDAGHPIWCWFPPITSIQPHYWNYQTVAFAWHIFVTSWLYFIITIYLLANYIKLIEKFCLLIANTIGKNVLKMMIYISDNILIMEYGIVLQTLWIYSKAISDKTAWNSSN